MNEETKRLFKKSHGFGVFVGQIVKVKTRQVTRIMRVQWVDRDSRVISFYNPSTGGYSVEAVDEVQLKPTAERHATILFSEAMLKQHYKMFSSVAEKCYFLYHYYGCGKKAAEKCCKKLSISTVELKHILQEFRKHRLI